MKVGKAFDYSAPPRSKQENSYGTSLPLVVMARAASREQNAGIESVAMTLDIDKPEPEG